MKVYTFQFTDDELSKILTPVEDLRKFVISEKSDNMLENVRRLQSIKESVINGAIDFWAKAKAWMAAQDEQQQEDSNA